MKHLVVCVALVVGFASPARAQDRTELRVTRALTAVARLRARHDERGALRTLRRALRRVADVRLALSLCEVLEDEGLGDAEASECASELTRTSATDPTRTEAERASIERLLLATRIATLGPSGALADAASRMRPQSEPLVRELRAIALAAIRGDDLITAQRALERARESMPQSVEVLSDLGLVLLSRGRAAEAASVFASAVARRPGDLALVRDLAGAWMASGEPNRAAMLLVETLRDGSIAAERAAPLELDAARAFLELGEDALALDHASRAATLSPSDAEPLVVMARIHLASGDASAARAALDEALLRDPESASARRARDALE